MVLRRGSLTCYSSRKYNDKMIDMTLYNKDAVRRNFAVKSSRNPWRLFSNATPDGKSLEQGRAGARLGKQVPPEERFLHQAGPSPTGHSYPRHAARRCQEKGAPVRRDAILDRLSYSARFRRKVLVGVLVRYLVK